MSNGPPFDSPMNAMPRFSSRPPRLCKIHPGRQIGVDPGDRPPLSVRSGLRAVILADEADVDGGPSEHPRLVRVGEEDVAGPLDAFQNVVGSRRRVSPESPAGPTVSAVPAAICARAFSCQ